MKKYTLFLICCLVTFIAAVTVSAQGFTGPDANPPTPPRPGSNPPPPPGPGVNPPPPRAQGFSGQYGFTGPVRTVTVAQALTFGHKTPVIVRGTIVHAIGGDLYTFHDTSGEITLRIGPREWELFGSTISPSDTIEISGEVHWPPRNWQNTPELHARFIRKL